jgi:hypothetical protein
MHGVPRVAMAQVSRPSPPFHAMATLELLTTIAHITVTTTTVPDATTATVAIGGDSGMLRDRVELIAAITERDPPSHILGGSSAIQGFAHRIVRGRHCWRGRNCQPYQQCRRRSHERRHVLKRIW